MRGRELARGRARGIALGTPHLHLRLTETTRQLCHLKTTTAPRPSRLRCAPRAYARARARRPDGGYPLGCPILGRQAGPPSRARRATRPLQLQGRPRPPAGARQPRAWPAATLRRRRAGARSERQKALADGRVAPALDTRQCPSGPSLTPQFVALLRAAAAQRTETVKAQTHAPAPPAEARRVRGRGAQQGRDNMHEQEHTRARPCANRHDFLSVPSFVNAEGKAEREREREREREKEREREHVAQEV